MNNPNLDHDSSHTPDYTLDTTGLICPEPVMLLHKTARQAVAGETIKVIATDPATTRDIPNFCRHLGHKLLNQRSLGTTTDTDNTTIYYYLIQKKPP